MLNLIVEVGQLVSLAIVAYGALLYLEHSDLFQEMTKRAQAALVHDRMGRLDHGDLNVSI